jgi:hypothetical protein
MSFLELYDNKYKSRLGPGRFKCFRKAFELLEGNKEHSPYYIIVETGTVRNPSNMMNEGGSTILFDEFVNFYDGKVFSVDIDKSACDVCRKIVSPKTEVIHGDSVKFLYNFKNIIDFLYLDSYDLHPHTRWDCYLHHMKEFCAAQKNLIEGSIVLTDDNPKETSGKGLYVDSYMKHIGKKRAIDGYQWGWII